MSLISTTPQFNPTEIDKNPTQVLITQPIGTCADFYPDGRNIMKKNSSIHVENLSFSKVAEIEKFLEAVIWQVDSTDNWLKLEFSIENLEVIVTDFAKDFKWRDFSLVQFNMKTTLNAYVAGLTLFVYDPAPTDDYWSVMFDVDINNPYYMAQFPNVQYEPTKSTQISWYLPIANPFRMYPSASTTENPFVNAPHKYIREYSMGRLYAYPLVPLKTGSTGITNAPFTLRAKMMGLHVAGTDYAHNE